MPQPEPIDPGKYNFLTLMNDIENGRVRLPPFQREFVWSPTKVIDLMDSLYKGFPIGSFFYWKADRKYVTLFRDIKSLSLPSPALDQELFFILDGQQRLTSIWATFKGSVINDENYARICLDLDAGADYEKGDPEARRQIKVFKETEADNITFISLHDILSDNVGTYDAIRDPLPLEKKQTLSKARDRFRNYPFSVVKVFNLELEDAVEVFQRINQGGKRLTRFELVAANCWSESFDLAKAVKEFNERVKQRTDFGMVEPITFVQAMSLVEFGQCKTEHELKLRSKKVEELWPRISKAIGDAIDWMRDNYGVIRGDMIPYYAMLAVLASYFSEHGTNVPLEHKTWIDRWFWRSAFSERYAKAQTSQMANDTKAIRELIDGKVELPGYPLTVSKDDIRKMRINRASGAARNAILCLLAHAKPRHFVTGTDISLAKDHFSDIKDPNAHHIFPKNFLKKGLKRYVEEVHLLPNFCFLPADLNNKIKDRPPSEYFAEFRGSDGNNPNFDAALRSHLIPSGADSPIWMDDYDAFLQQRTELIWAEILKAVGEGDIYNSGAPVPRDQARLAVDEIEVKLRRIVHDIMRTHLGDDYWKTAVPGDLQAKIKERITERNRSKVVTRIDDPLIRLQYADIMDLHKIVDKNWDLFKDHFESRETLKSHFLALKNYRNPLGHVRDIDVVEQKQGEAAIIWFRRSLISAVEATASFVSEKEEAAT
ncbi:MAG: DUF262 domain-containing protein [Acidobacteriia bacterium]|nr:DUF262 domain-containing protein [Terriglobia bacterium]